MGTTRKERNERISKASADAGLKLTWRQRRKLSKLVKRTPGLPAAIAANPAAFRESVRAAFQNSLVDSAKQDAERGKNLDADEWASRFRDSTRAMKALRDVLGVYQQAMESRLSAAQLDEIMTAIRAKGPLPEWVEHGDKFIRLLAQRSIAMLNAREKGIVKGTE